MEELVEYETKIISNFLTQSRFKYASFLAIGMLSLIIAVSSFYWNSASEITGYLQANPLNVLENKEYWRLITSTLIHADLAHLLSNCLMLFIISYFIILHYGAFIYPFVGIIMGALVNYFVLLSFDSNITIVGASGVVYYLWGFWLILYILIQRHIGLLRRIMKVTIISLVILFPSEFNPNVSYLAHALGFIFGVGSGLIYYVFNKSFIHSREVKARFKNVIPDIDYAIRDYELFLEEN